MADDVLREFIAKINAAYKGEIVEVGGRFGALTLGRFSSGILSLDCALGGGFPFSRVMVVAGNESSGKTLMALKAVEQIKNYDHHTHLHRDFCDPKTFLPGRCLFVDLEGTFDLAWAKAVANWDTEWHAVARPEYAEQAIDIVGSAMEENVFDLIVVDSIAQMTPTKEIECSAEDWQQGLAARLMNKAMRKWVARLNKISQGNPAGGPAIMCLNQFRVTMGVMYGDPRVMPGGKGQVFASSIIIYNRSQKVSDGADKETSSVELGGVTMKNKTYVPKLNFTYNMGLRDGEKLAKGEVDNLKQLYTLGSKYGIIEHAKTGDDWYVGKRSWKTKKALLADMEDDTALYRLLWRSVVAAATEKVEVADVSAE